jgi:hypothetical protein
VGSPHRFRDMGGALTCANIQFCDPVVTTS